MVFHARRRRMDEAVGGPHRFTNIGDRKSPFGGKPAVQIFGQTACTGNILIENRETLDAEFHRGMCHRDTGAAGTQKDSPMPRNVRKAALKVFVETVPVRVVAGTSSILEYDSVDRAEHTGVVRKDP